MILLAKGVAILDEHTRLARLETDNSAPLLTAALGAAAAVDLVDVHHVLWIFRFCPGQFVLIVR